MSVNDLLEKAKDEIKNLQTNETFSLKDLFKGYEWKRIKQGDKSMLGTLFLNYAQCEPKIEVNKKNNSLIYKIKG